MSRKGQNDGKVRRARQRLADRLKPVDVHKLNPLPDYPVEKFSVLPDRVECDVSMKFVGKMRWNRKYKCILNRGYLELFQRKTKQAELTNEYRIDLAKVAVHSDEKRIAIKFQVEALLLTPLDPLHFPKFKEFVVRHRLYRQEISKNPNLDHSFTGDLPCRSSTVTAVAPLIDDSIRDLSVTNVQLLNSIKEMQTLTITLLDKTSRNLDELRETIEEFRRIRETSGTRTAVGLSNLSLPTTTPMTSTHPTTPSTNPQIPTVPTTMSTSNGHSVDVTTTTTASTNALSTQPRTPLTASTANDKTTPGEEDSESEEDSDDYAEEQLRSVKGVSDPNIIFSLEATVDQRNKSDVIKSSLQILEEANSTYMGKKQTSVREAKREVKEAGPSRESSREHSRENSSQPATPTSLSSFQSYANSPAPRLKVSTRRSVDDKKNEDKRKINEEVPVTPLEVIKAKVVQPKKLPLIRQRRETLPAPQPPSEGIGIRKMYQMFTTKSIPITQYEPLDMMQIMAEQFNFSDLLDKAAMAKTPEDRMSWVVAFSVASYCLLHGRFRKPFNPILGGTYDYEYNGWRFHAEQVSHHPPVSASQAEGNNWILTETLHVDTIVIKLQNSAELIGHLPIRVKLKIENGTFEEYTWNKPRMKIEGLTYPPEQRKVWYEGTSNFKASNGTTARLRFRKGKTPTEMSGEILNSSGTIVSQLNGSYEKNLQRTTNGHIETLFDGSHIRRFANFYGFSQFTFDLNEVEKGAVLPSTDTRNRPDIRQLELGNLIKASECKETVEKTQRARASKPYSPLWFDAYEDETTHLKTYTCNGKYWNSKEKKFPEITFTSTEFFGC